MPTDNTLAVRKAVVRHLKNDADLTALVSSASIYGEEPPSELKWPFIRLGFIITSPFEAQGWDGSEHRLTIHAFCHGPFTDATIRVNAAIVDAMKSFQVPELGIVDLQWRGSEIVRDTDEASAFHGINQFDYIGAS